MSQLFSLEEVNAMIDQGKYLHVAGDEKLLLQLHKGSWIGGTIPYFLTSEGGVVEREKLFVHELPNSVLSVSTRFVHEEKIAEVSTSAPKNGFSLVIIPGMSSIHSKYALAVDYIETLFDTPILGWVSGVYLDDLGLATPKVINGATGEVSAEQMVVLHAELPETHIATIGIINLFQQGTGDEIVFDSTSFSAKSCTINGQADDFYDYVVRTKFDEKLPLVADRCGEMINVSLQKLDAESHTVHFYAPLIEGVTYRQAAPLGDYRAELIKATERLGVSPVFSCNCILNYLYGSLEGPQSMPVPGPATFGEVAYILLNQTLVYLDIQS